jgi:hypothetical protein
MELERRFREHWLYDKLIIIIPGIECNEVFQSCVISDKELGHTWRTFWKKIEREYMLNFHTPYFHWELYAVHTIFSLIYPNVYFKNRSIPAGGGARRVVPATSLFFFGTLFGFKNSQEFSEPFPSNVYARKFYCVCLLVTTEFKFD